MHASGRLSLDFVQADDEFALNSGMHSSINKLTTFPYQVKLLDKLIDI